jgi:O-antigen/teichoic acid export membrane protein
VLYALQTALAAFAVAGIVESVMGLLNDYRDRGLCDRLFSTANGLFILLSLISTVLVLLVYWGITPVSRATGWLLLAVVIGGVLVAYSSLQGSLIRLEERHGESLTIGFLPPIVGIVGGVIALRRASDVASYFIGSTIAMAIAMTLLAWLRIGSYGVDMRWRQLQPLLASITPFLVLTLLSWAGGYGNTFVVQGFFGTADVAKFTFVYTLSSILQLVATALNQAWSPTFLRIVHQLPRFEVERRYRRFTTGQGLALGLMGAALLVLAPFGIDIVGGNLVAYRNHTIELLLLCAAYAVSIPWWHAQNYFYAYGSGSTLMRTTVAGTLAGMSIWVLAIVMFGTIGVYAGFFAQMMARMLTTAVRAGREWSLSFAWPGMVLALVLLCAGALTSILIGGPA